MFDKTRHTIIVSRGCVNSCSYCSNHKLKLQNEGNYLSFRKIEDIIKELSILLKKYKNIKIIHLESESMSMNLNFTYSLFSAIENFNKKLDNKICFVININLTPSLIKNVEYFIDKLKKANIKLVCIGLESGSSRLRNKILHRPKYTNKDFVKFCMNLMKHDIMINIYVLLGLPTEKEYNLKQTLSILNKIKPNEISHSIFYPYPNTDLYDLMVDMKLIKPRQIVKAYPERRVICVEYPDLSKEIIQKYYDKIELMVKTTKEKKFLILSKLLLNKH